MISVHCCFLNVNGLLCEYVTTLVWLPRCERVQIQVAGGIAAKLAAKRRTDTEVINMQPHITRDCQW